MQAPTFVDASQERRAPMNDLNLRKNYYDVAVLVTDCIYM
jgi:hypothetical protein